MPRLIPFFTILLSAYCASGATAEYSDGTDGTQPHVETGSVTRLLVNSASLSDAITTDIWLPESYDSSDTRVYPVVYAHDGQNLFDPALSFAGVAWNLHLTASELAAQNIIEMPIIVGIHNRGAKGLRANDYFPEKALEYLDDSESQTYIWETCKAGFFGDKYAAFIAEELKPLIDTLFRTKSDSFHTFVMGSSMGALASLYLFCEYPDIFGGAVCMSTHWPGSLRMRPDYTIEDDPACARAIIEYIDSSLPDPDTHRLYLDQGTQGWDAVYLKYEPQARTIVQGHGYAEDTSLMTFDAVGAAHNEWYWNQRVWRPLSFILGRPTSGDSPVNPDSKASAGILRDLLGRPVNGRPAPGVYIKDSTKFIVR